MLSERMQMLLEIAAEGEQSEADSPDTTQVEETSVEETKEESTEDGTETEQEADVPTKFNIDGEEITPEQIKEWKKGHMRQSDYTRKTQELAALRKQAADAMELYEYLKANPEIARRLESEAPEYAERTKDIINPELQEINVKLTAMEIEKFLDMKKLTDPDFDEVGVINIAQQERVPIEKAYEMWKGRNLDAIVQKKLAEQSKNLTKQIKNNNEQTKTLITKKSGDANDFGLTKTEMEMASKLGMKYSEYAKWKT